MRTIIYQISKGLRWFRPDSEAAEFQDFPNVLGLDSTASQEFWKEAIESMHIEEPCLDHLMPFEIDSDRFGFPN